MKILFETNRKKIRNIDALDKALNILENDSKQGFFRSKGESEFRLFNERSLVEDGKLIELHIVKVEGKGEYKFNGNLSYNSRTNEVKFYILSVIEFDTFNYDEKRMIGFINEPNESPEHNVIEIKAVISKIKKTKPAFDRRANSGSRNRNSFNKSYPKKTSSTNEGHGQKYKKSPSNNYKKNNSKEDGYKSNRNNESSDNGQKDREESKRRAGYSDRWYRSDESGNNKSKKQNTNSTPNPKRQPLTEKEKEKRNKNSSKKNFRTDQRRNVANNKKAKF